MMISVIMSVYNAEKYLAEAIKSILDQTYENFEFIIIDDGSSDSSKSIIEDFKVNDNRIVFLKNAKNLGLTKNLNKAIKISRGNLIARIDADDISLPERFQKQVDFLNNNKDIAVVGGYCIDVDAEGREIRKRTVPTSNEDIRKTIYKVNPICHPTVMFRKKELSKIGFYDENHRVVQDYDLWFRCVINDIGLSNISDYLLKYRVDDTYVARKSWKYRITDFNIRRKAFRKLKLPFYKKIYMFTPIIIGLVPPSIYYFLKRYDPR